MGIHYSPLQTKLPELMVLGDYAPEKRTGPAIWLRCVLARQIEGIDFPVDTPPIFISPMSAVRICVPWMLALMH